VSATVMAWLRYLAIRLAWPGQLGLLLVLAAAALALIAASQVDVQNTTLRQEAGELRQQLATETTSLPEAESNNLRVLPGGDELVPLVAAVHACARRREVALDEGEYVWAKEPGGRSGRYRMLFPAHGTYPQLRGWAADVLARRPALVLDEFNVRRENIGSAQVEARVRFSARIDAGEP